MRSREDPLLLYKRPAAEEGAGVKVGYVGGGMRSRWKSPNDSAFEAKS